MSQISKWTFWASRRDFRFTPDSVGQADMAESTVSAISCQVAKATIRHRATSRHEDRSNPVPFADGTAPMNFAPRPIPNLFFELAEVTISFIDKNGIGINERASFVV